MNYKILKNGAAAEVLKNGRYRLISKSKIKKSDKKV